MIWGRTTFVVLWIALLSAAVVGLNIGATAETPAEANIEFNGTHLTVGDNTSNVVDPEARPEPDAPPRVEWLSDRLESYERPGPELVSEEEANAMTEQLVVNTFVVMTPVMDAAATFAHRHGSPAVNQVLRLLLYVGFLAPLGVLVWPLAQALRGGSA